MNYVYFVHLNASTRWLSLSREARRQISHEHVHKLLEAEPSLRMRYFDAEAFTTDCSDLMMIECDDPTRYNFFIERLRDSPLIAAGYFEMVRIIPAIEDGYVQFEAQQS